MLIWPQSLRVLEPDWVEGGGRTVGGGAFGGASQTAELSGGGLWRLRGQVLLRTLDAVAAARALRGSMAGGAPIEMTVCEQLRARIPGGSGASVPYEGGIPHSDGSWFASSPVTATVNGGWALRAVRGLVNINAPLKGSEGFSYKHPNFGKRRYQVNYIHSQGGGVADVTWWPPLREAIAAGQSLDFNRPTCVMYLPSPEAFPLPVTGRPLETTTIELEEWFGPSLAPAPPAVELLTAEDTGTGQATIEWKNPWSSKLATRQVFQGSATDDFEDAISIHGPAAATRGAFDSYVKTGLSAATYRFWVVTYSAGGDASAPVMVEVAVT